MKKFFIIFFNLILFILLYHFACACFKYHPDMVPPSYIVSENYSNIDYSEYETEDLPKDFIKLEYTDESRKDFCGEERRIFGDQYINRGKNPIVVFGCSYAYGHGLKKSESFPYLLSDLTKRPVYNFAECGMDALRNFNWLIPFFKDSDEKYLNSIKNSDYVIYVYMFDHINRFFLTQNLIKYYDDIFETSKIERLINKFYLIRFIKSKLKQKEIMDNYPFADKSSILLKKVMLFCYRQYKTYFPNSKLIIVIFDEKMHHNLPFTKFTADNMNSKIWKELEEETNGDIKAVHTKDLVGFSFGNDYRLKADIDDIHPNDKAWKLFTPLLVKKIML